MTDIDVQWCIAMRLHAEIDRAIWRYPMLYKLRSYKESRLRVLDHLFLVLGNGFQWSSDGYLYDSDRFLSAKEVPPYGVESHPSLPKGYFDKELWAVTNVTKDSAIAVQKYLNGQGAFCYLILRDKAISQSTTDSWDVIFAAKESKPDGCVYVLEDFYPGAGRLCVPIHKFLRKNEPFDPRDSMVTAACGKASGSFVPYPVSEGTKIFELFQGKTYREGRPFTAQPDWVCGAVEVSKESLAYFTDERRYKDGRFGRGGQGSQETVAENVEFHRKFLATFEAKLS